MSDLVKKHMEKFDREMYWMIMPVTRKRLEWCLIDYKKKCNEVLNLVEKETKICV